MERMMPALIGLFLIFLQFCYGLKIEKQQDDGELVFTSVLYRHGERTPEKPYTNDPYKDDSYWPIGWGQLTNNGKRQHYELGKMLRNRYLSLIRGGKYSTSLIYVRSTDWDRTLMSATSNLAGMFYPTQAELWSDIKWQPIPVHTIPKQLDKLLAMEYPCPKYREQLEEFYNSGLMKRYNQKHQALYDYLTEHAGEPVDDPIKVQTLYSTLYIQLKPKIRTNIVGMEYPRPKYRGQLEEFYNSGLMKSYNQKHQALYDYLIEHAGEPVDDPIKVQYLYTTLHVQTLNNYTLPAWAQHVLTKEIYDVSAFGFKMPVFTKTLKRLFGGPLLKDILEHMKAKRSGKLSPDRNLWVYSAHDTTVSAFLETMGVFEIHMPPFAATVLVELRKKNDKFSVSVYYKNSTAEPALLTIPGCTASCPLDDFEKLLSDVIPKDWDAECKTFVRNPIYDQGAPELAENEPRNIRM